LAAVFFAGAAFLAVDLPAAFLAGDVLAVFVFFVAVFAGTDFTADRRLATFATAPLTALIAEVVLAAT
jgi:hypothetical protein